MISKHVGGEVVESGIYWRRSTGEFVQISSEGGRLMGTSGEWYVKAPLPLVLIAGPVMGLLFFMTLPLSGMLVLVPFLAGKVRTAVSSGGLSPVRMATRVQPGVSCLEPRQGRPAGHDGEIDADDAGKLVDLAGKIAEKRGQDR